SNHRYDKDLCITPFQHERPGRVPMNGSEITQNLSNNYTYQYTQTVNAPAEELVQAKPMDT
ncbi:MAG: hypothetical protein WBL08_04240, partial [Planktomarina temperata]